MMTSLQHDILTFVAGQVVTLYDMMTSLQHDLLTSVAGQVVTLYDMMTLLSCDVLSTAYTFLPFLLLSSLPKIQW